MTISGPTSRSTTARPFRFAMLLPTLIVDVAAPIVIFKVLQWRGVSPVLALGAGGLPPLINNLRIWIRSRRLEPIGILVVASIVIGTVATLISNNIFYILIKDSFLTGAYATVFLVTIFIGRPMIYDIIRQFVAGEDAARNELWNGLWRYAEFRSMMRSMTLVWGVVFMLEALLRISLAVVLPSRQMVTMFQILGIGSTLATLPLIVFTRRRMILLRERLELMEHLRWPL